MSDQIEHGSSDFLATFERERARKADVVYDAHPDLLRDHRSVHPWLTGAVGNPRCPVWSVAENPSLAQVERVRDPTPESQWLHSRADRLVRDMLVEHGYKDAPWDAKGGWRCYITDVIKSADRAGEWGRKPADVKRATVDAWAPVLDWELRQGQPKVLVALGKPADRYLARLARQGRIQIGSNQTRVRIAHYSYIALRPDGPRGPMHPERVDAYRAQFKAIAAHLAG